MTTRGGLVLALNALLSGATAPAWANGSKLDFDQGVDSRSILKDARDRAGRAASPSARAEAPTSSCKIDFRGVRLELTGDRKYGRAEYKIGADCKPVLESVSYSTAIPSEALERLRERSPRRREAVMRKSRPGGAGAPLDASLDSCTMSVCEKDVVGVTMITLQNGTAWDADDSGNVLDANVHANIFGNLDWWFVTGKPTINIVFPSATEGYSQVDGGFYCEGVGPISNYVCGSQPSYNITLEGDMSFYGDGSCYGAENYSGETVPLGNVTCEIVKGS
jgi:hypothetical protein